MRSAKVLYRAYRSLRGQGVTASIGKLRALITDRLFDLRFGVETSAESDLAGLTIASANREAGYRYDPARVLPLRRALSALRPLFNPDSILVDIGSGKGRVLLVASEFGFRSVR